MSVEDKLLRVRNLSRYFGEIAALEGITFDIEPGEVLGVVGQRNSGKSTLFHLLSGAYQPTSGEIFFANKQVWLKNPSIAQRMGIEIVYQDLQLDDNQDVLQNIFLGRELYALETLKIWPIEKKMELVAKELIISFDMSAELIHEAVTNLTNEQKMIVALVRALSRPSRLLMLDNSLVALRYERQQLLINRIKELAAQNLAIIISSDDLKHIFSITDHILVLYEGSQVALRRTSETTPSEIVELIVGSNRQEQITPVIWAFEKFHEAQQQAEELHRAQLELRQNLEAQDSLNQQLVERLSDQVNALDRLNLALQDANRRLMTEREAERKALARDLHDQVIQDLISYSYQLEGIEDEIDIAGQSQELFKIRNGIRQVVSSLRQMCSDLRPPTIDSQGLSAAIHSLAHQWSVQNNIAVQLEIDPQLGRLPEMIELSVFRIIQEGLANVRKHAKANEVNLILLRTPKASLVVKLSDNGQGIEKTINLASLAGQKHYGLVGISERVSLLGGTMKVKSPSQGGFELQIEIPSPYPSINA